MSWYLGQYRFLAVMFLVLYAQGPDGVLHRLTDPVVIRIKLLAQSKTDGPISCRLALAHSIAYQIREVQPDVLQHLRMFMRQIHTLSKHLSLFVHAA